MPKTFTLDGAPSSFFRPDRAFLDKWCENRGIVTREQEQSSSKSLVEKQKKAS